MLPSPQELTYFSEVAHCLNLSRASKKLHVTQPTLSLAIKKLEQSIGTHLFIRHKQGVTLTPAGAKLLEQVKPLLQQWDRTKLEVKNTHDAVQGTVTVGCRSITPTYMQDFLINLFEKHPKLVINFKALARNQIIESVINSSIDIGLVADPFEHNDLVIRKIGELELGLWTGLQNKPLQNIHSGEAVIICEAHAPQAQQFIRKLEQEGISFARIITVDNLEVVAQFAANGLGIGIIPPCLAQTSFPGTLKRVDDTPLSIEDLCIVYRYENKSVLAVKTLIDAIVELANHWEKRKQEGHYES